MLITSVHCKFLIMFCLMSGFTLSLIRARELMNVHRSSAFNVLSDDLNSLASINVNDRFSSNHTVKPRSNHSTKNKVVPAGSIQARAMKSSTYHSRVGGWSFSFDQLLEDPAGLHTFSEFLKSQFSHENIYFWVACQRYKKCAPEERPALAQSIFDRHLMPGAVEPVNLESHTVAQINETSIQEAAVSLFQEAEDHIYKLMLYDCYPRFLQSNIFEDCVFIEENSEPLPYLGDDSMSVNLRLNDGS